MPKLPVLSGQEVRRVMETCGFQMVRQRGSHMVMQQVISENNMAIEIINGESHLGVFTGSLDGREWIIGTTPVTDILHVDGKDHRAELVGVKYSTHRPSDSPKGNRDPDPYTRVTMLVAGGPWEQRMWDESSGKSLTVRLNSPGDYIAWMPGPCHSWTPIGNTTMLTVTYKTISRQ